MGKPAESECLNNFFEFSHTCMSVSFVIQECDCHKDSIEHSILSRISYDFTQLYMVHNMAVTYYISFSFFDGSEK